MTNTPIIRNTRPVIVELNKRRARTKSGTDAEVARDLNISASLIAMIRSGKRYPSPLMLKLLNMEAVVTYREARHD